MTEATVTYAVKDYKNKGQWKEKTVPGEEFIRRFLMHVPPKRFVSCQNPALWFAVVPKQEQKDDAL